MTHAQQFLLDALLKEIDPMFEEDRPSRLSTLLRRLRNLHQRVTDEFTALSADLDATQPVAPQPRPVEASWGCPHCRAFIPFSDYERHLTMCLYSPWGKFIDTLDISLDDTQPMRPFTEDDAARDSK